MYIFLIILIIITSILLVFTVLAQDPKGGMAANFGASTQVMGARQTADFLERFTWGLAIAMVGLSLLASIAMSSHRRNAAGNSDAILEKVTTEQEIALPNNAATATQALPGTDIPAGMDVTEPNVTTLEEVTETAE